LFYVALTKGRKTQAYLTLYSRTDYRWGKLVDAEPSRFIEEIDEKNMWKFLTPFRALRYTPLIDVEYFWRLV